MQTHEDSDAGNELRKRFMDQLQAKAERMVAEGKSKIAGGDLKEEPLAEWKCKENGMWIRHMPDDEHDIIRVSVGGGDHLPVTMNYCTIRGTVGQAIQMLEKAIVALRSCPD